MRKIAYIVLLMLCTLSLSAQKPSCDFLGPLNFKNGKATVIVKAMYTDALRSGAYLFFKELEKKKILDSKKYFVFEKIEGEGYMDTGSAISFVPEKCTREYTATIARKINFGLFKVGQTLYLKCTVYQHVPGYKDEPFFVIDEATYKSDDVPKQQNIGRLSYLNQNKLAHDIGTSYFSDDGENLQKLNCLLVITPKRQAIVETAGNKQHVFSYTKRMATKTGYIDFYRNPTEWFELNINRVIHHGSEKNSTRIGRLTISINHATTAVNVYGYTEDADKYNSLKY